MHARIKATESGNAIRLQAAAIDEMLASYLALRRVQNKLARAAFYGPQTGVGPNHGAGVLNQLGIFFGDGVKVGDPGFRYMEPRDALNVRLEFFQLFPAQLPQPLQSVGRAAPI